MTLLGQRTITRRRWPVGGGYDEDGRWVPPTPADVEILASVQELTGRELEQLDLAERARDPIKVYTVADLQTTDQEAGTQADHLLVDGHWYKVRNVGPRHPLIPHVKATAIRLQEAG